ncbi:unnamed protein product [Spirodela intermedia]|uniref:acylaminoacyl-peptidase n=1 Tax=Spirodela intermedia TaxID=51605 RepID=A0A7I8I867_SPIIN|nr:unnamed protein product [Spirodela intermedia]CAA6653678.1 unnamed protein product [Spirodela intermedia]
MRGIRTHVVERWSGGGVRICQRLPPFAGSRHLPVTSISDFWQHRRLPERRQSPPSRVPAGLELFTSSSVFGASVLSAAPDGSLGLGGGVHWIRLFEPPSPYATGVEETSVEEYASQVKLLKEFTDIPSIDRAWTIKSGDDVGASAIIPSPSGSKLLVVRNKENDSPTILEIWGPSQLEKEWQIPRTVHGSVYTDAWFEGISWNQEENMIAYVAEEASFKIDGASEKECGSWKGQGDWEEDWGETYPGKQKPALFVLDINSGKAQVVKGIDESLSAGQVVWAPYSSDSPEKYLIFVGWTPENARERSSRKLGIKYCNNRPCALYAVQAPAQESTSNESENANATGCAITAIKLTDRLNSAFFPRFSPDGKYLVFLSAKSAVDSGAHSATNSLHRMDWPADGKPCSSGNVIDVVPVVMCAEDGCFPGLYCPFFLNDPWLPDGHTMVLCSYWGSRQVILSVDILSYKLSNITPADSNHSWNVLAVDGGKILAVCSSPIDPPQIKYGCPAGHSGGTLSWNWLDISSPFLQHSEKVRNMLSMHQFSIMKIPIGNSDTLPKGAQLPMEAIFVSSSNSQSKEPFQVNQKSGSLNPLIVVIHGGPHSVSLTSYSKSLAFLASLGFNLLIVNYRGSLGFGEEALQTLPGKIGSQDVGDVLKAIDHVIETKLADPSKIAVLGGSHGGFLTTHLIGQAPERFAVAAVRNPVCNLSLMVGTTDIPDWCYVETYGKDGKDHFTEAPSVDQLGDMYSKSPISHISKVKTPILFLLGAQDLRVPVSNGLQYARALKERGAEVKVIVFPKDIHSIDRPQSDFESFVNIGVWFKKYCR